MAIWWKLSPILHVGTTPLGYSFLCYVLEIGGPVARKYGAVRANVA